jgi:phosphotransferase system HPr-like phosphotransfer protein
LSDLVHPRTAVHLLLNPYFAHSVCRIIGLDARTVIGREVRPNRLLPLLGQPLLPLTLTDHLHSVPSAKIVLLLQDHPNVRLFLAREGRPEARITNSLIGLLLMGVKKGETVVFRAEGEGAFEVLDRIQDYNDAEWFHGDRKRGLVTIRELRMANAEAMASQLMDAMGAFKERELAAVYHPKKRRFVVGHILSTHKEIARSAGFDETDAYLRLNFDARGGILRACFAPGADEEKKTGREYLVLWLRDLFRGIDVGDIVRPS